MKAIALYLPQFHPTPYNDEWWGEGFTEWANVARATPQYEGHFQPRLPDKFGFYDLRVPEIMQAQEKLAADFGIHGFCYYYYRFDGRRALEYPLEQKLARKDLTLPFCICWANENWTRRWDGQESEVLIKQRHNDDDDLQFIKDSAPMLMDERYIRVNGKPLLMIYRTELWSDITRTAKRWREYMQANYGVDLYLVRCDGFQRDINPSDVGFDAAYQFPPLGFSNGREAIDRVKFNANFEGGMPDYNNWRGFVKKNPAHKLFRGVMPSWDNTPRKQTRSHIIYGSSPAAYKEWISEAVKYTLESFSGDEQLLFINAWNEWAEGAILEPCKQWGYDYLNATKEAMS